MLARVLRAQPTSAHRRRELHRDEEERRGRLAAAPEAPTPRTDFTHKSSGANNTEGETTLASKPVALVTGASSGIGQATAELLAAHGFTVFGTSRAPTQSERSYTWLSLDVRSDDSVQAAVQSLLAQA